MTHSPLIPGFNWQHREPYGTHQPVLYEAIKRSEGAKHPFASMPILELGCGFYSTHLTYTIAGDRQVISVDSDQGWIDDCKRLYGGKENHQFKLASFEEMQMNGCYSVVFVDQGDWVSRMHSLKHYAAAALFVVLHDSDYLIRELGVDFGKLYYYHKTFMPLQPYPYHTGPPTTIMSNFVDVTGWEINYEDYK